MLKGMFSVVVGKRSGVVEIDLPMIDNDMSIVSFDDGGLAWVWNDKIKVVGGVGSNLDR